MERTHITLVLQRGEEWEDTEVNDTSCFLFICFLSLLLPPHFKRNTVRCVPPTENSSHLDFVQGFWPPAAGTNLQIIPVQTHTSQLCHPSLEPQSISIPYLQVVMLPVIGRESPSSYVDLTLMKYWVRDDNGLRTADVAVPGTSICSGGDVRLSCEKG